MEPFVLVAMLVFAVLFLQKIRNVAMDETGTRKAVTKRYLAADDGQLGARQFEALVQLYHSTNMTGWPISSSDYCSWDGLGCDSRGLIVSIDLNETGLSGSLPDVFDDLPALKRLRFYNNSLYGELPESLLQLDELAYLNVGHNFLTGVFPDFSGVSQLKRLVTDRNAFSGTLPASLCELKSLEVLEVSAITKMSGSIPACLGSLRNLSQFRVTDVGLVGTVPPELCDGRRMNGFSPNKFGCAAIACPAKFYQRGRGHQTSVDEPCKKCDVPSNVIGSTTCLWHEIFDRDTTVPTRSPSPSVAPSHAPTGPPTQEPTKRVTNHPTQQPTESPTGQPTERVTSHPTQQHPTKSPTGKPTSFTQSPTEPPTQSPSFSTSLSEIPTVESSKTSIPAPTLSPSWEPSFRPSDSASFPSLPPSSVASALVAEAQSNGRLLGSAGRYTAAAVSLFALVALVSLFLAKRRQRETTKHVAMDDCDNLALQIDENLSVEVMNMGLHPVNEPCPPVNEPRSSLRRTSSVVDNNNNNNKIVVQPTRRVRFALPEKGTSTDSKNSSIFRRQIDEREKAAVEGDSWFPWMTTPFFDPVNSCTSGCRSNYSDDVISTKSESTLTSGLSRGQTDSELDSILGIRGRPVLETEESNTWASLSSYDTLLGPKPSSKIPSVGSDADIEQTYHDVLDSDSLFNDLGEGMVEV